MKINWGFKIVIVYSVFVLGIMTMVFLSAKENTDLVSENYYAEEIAYQQVIDQSSKTAALSTPVELTLASNTLTIQLPKSFSQQQTSGQWTLYYAADKKKDLIGNFHPQHGAYLIKLPAGTKGRFTLKLQWQTNGIEYYFEKSIFL